MTDKKQPDRKTDGQPDTHAHTVTRTQADDREQNRQPYRKMDRPTDTHTHTPTQTHTHTTRLKNR